MGTLNMLGLAKRTKARFLISSTSGKICPPINYARASCYAFVQRCTETPRFTHNLRISTYTQSCVAQFAISMFAAGVMSTRLVIVPAMMKENESLRL